MQETGAGAERTGSDRPSRLCAAAAPGRSVRRHRSRRARQARRASAAAIVQRRRRDFSPERAGRRVLPGRQRLGRRLHRRQGPGARAAFRRAVRRDGIADQLAAHRDYHGHCRLRGAAAGARVLSRPRAPAAERRACNRGNVEPPARPHAGRTEGRKPRRGGSCGIDSAAGRTGRVSNRRSSQAALAARPRPCRFRRSNRDSGARLVFAAAARHAGTRLVCAGRAARGVAGFGARRVARRNARPVARRRLGVVRRHHAGGRAVGLRDAGLGAGGRGADHRRRHHRHRRALPARARNHPAYPRAALPARWRRSPSPAC